ncbi:J domain-containing protein [Rhabdothermincola sp.]|uniref:J domain-containing protein n=1 Tax=Rhabdothermincola sp. TaxID=2820405 RepID=UPI002FE31BA6
MTGRRGGDTATHYEILGVRADASHDEIKRAYVERALRYHPDRHASSPPAEREAAAFRMQEVNAAWEVLRNPARRAAYDAELRGDRPVWERPAGGPPRPARTTTIRAGEDLPFAAPGFEVPARHAPLLRFGPVVVLGVVLLAVLVITAYANRGGDPHAADPGVAVETGAGTVRFEPGQCVLIVSAGGRLLPVPAGSCDQQGASRITQVTDLGRPCPTGSTPFDLQSDKLRLCLQA